MHPKLGFNPKEIDTRTAPGKDFFDYVNKKWITNNPIPDDESRWGTFVKLRYSTDRQVRNIFKELDRKRRATQGSEEQIVRDFYRSGMNMKLRNKLKDAPLLPLRKKIQNIGSRHQLVEVIALLTKKGITTPWDIAVDQDMKKNTINVFYMAQDGLGMSDKDYYLKKDKETLRVRRAYEKHIIALFTLIGYSHNDAVRRKDVVMSIETELAQASMSKVDQRDPYKLYNKKSRAGLKKIAPLIDWKMYFNDIGATSVRSLILEQPTFLRAVNRLFKTVSVENWKTYLEWHLYNDMASSLSQPFIDENFAFYGKVISGDKKLRPLWRRVTKIVESNVGEALGKIYVKKYFSEEAKQKLDELIDNLFISFYERLRQLEWMSATTKKKAYKKLHSMGRKIGYPDKWRSYKGLRIQPDTYAVNVMASSEFEHKREMRKIGKPIDKHEWFMYPQTVNAYYAPVRNEIVFPAAILQYPFFDKRADDAVNYGAIGTVIGHEMTHGFDDEGSKFDHNGNLKNWWTRSDRTRFEKRAHVLKKQFDAYSVAPGIQVNGKLTLGENIADLGGLAIAYDAFEKHCENHPQKTLRGFTPAQRFFIGYAAIWREHFRPQYIKEMVRVNSHAPDMFRTNGPVSNIEIFYDAFGVKPGDKLYRAPKDRAQIW